MGLVFAWFSFMMMFEVVAMTLACEWEWKCREVCSRVFRHLRFFGMVPHSIMRGLR